MSQHIEIEYCGGWGFFNAANKLKKTLARVFPSIYINCYSAPVMTSLISVYWVKNELKTLVWEDGRSQTEFGHSEIIKNLRQVMELWHHPRINNDRLQMSQVSQTFNRGNLMILYGVSWWEWELLTLKYDKVKHLIQINNDTSSYYKHQLIHQPTTIITQ